MNLVERLREGAVNEFTDYGNLCDEAADRIEELEVMLKYIDQHDIPEHLRLNIKLALNKGKDQ